MALNAPSLISLIDATSTTASITSGLGKIIANRIKPPALLASQDPAKQPLVWQEFADSIFEKLFPILLTSLSKTATYYLNGEVKKLSAITTTSVPLLAPPHVYPELTGALTAINAGGLYSAMNLSGTKSNASSGIGAQLAKRIKIEALPASQNPALAWKIWQAVSEILTQRMLTALTSVSVAGMISYISTAIPKGNTVPSSAAGTASGFDWAGTNPFSTTFTGTLVDYVLTVMDSSIYSSVTNEIGKIIHPTIKSAALIASQDPEKNWLCWQAFVDKYTPIFITNYVNTFSSAAITAIQASKPTLSFTPISVPGVLATVPTPSALAITFNGPVGYIGKVI